MKYNFKTGDKIFLKDISILLLKAYGYALPNCKMIAQNNNKGLLRFHSKFGGHVYFYFVGEIIGANYNYLMSSVIPGKEKISQHPLTTIFK